MLLLFLLLYLAEEAESASTNLGRWRPLGEAASEATPPPPPPAAAAPRPASWQSVVAKRFWRYTGPTSRPKLERRRGENRRRMSMSDRSVGKKEGNNWLCQFE